MKTIKRLTLALLLLVFSATMSLAAITQSDGSGPRYVRSTIQVIDTTNAAGDNCLGVMGYIYKGIAVTETSGTGIWNIEISNDFGSSYFVTHSAEAATAFYDLTSYAATNVCVHVTTCSTCQLDISVFAENAIHPN